MHFVCCVCRNARHSTSTMISNTNGAGADCMCVYNVCYILCLYVSKSQQLYESCVHALSSSSSCGSRECCIPGRMSQSLVLALNLCTSAHSFLFCSLFMHRSAKYLCLEICVSHAVSHFASLSFPYSSCKICLACADVMPVFFWFTVR